MMTRRVEKLNIAFLGSGDIAVPVLRALMDASGIEVSFVNTQPDRPVGRRRQFHPTPVGAFAEAIGVELYKLNVNSDYFHMLLEQKKPDMLLVIDFGQILREHVLSFPVHGCINIHASLLPKYRGASPIQSAILNGDDETGICFIQMESGLDTGPVYHRVRIPLPEHYHAEKLLAHLAELGAAHAPETLIRIASGELRPQPQDHSAATVCRKIRKEHGQADWRKPAGELAAKCRGYYGWPGLWFILKTARKTCRICITEAIVRPSQGTPSTVLSAGKEGWVIACGVGALEILRLIPEGKPEMSATEFLRGNPIHPGTLL